MVTGGSEVRVEYTLDEMLTAVQNEEIKDYPKEALKEKNKT